MAQKIRVLLTDDLDPSQEATETVRFALDGDYLEIDLTDAHARDLRTIFQPYMEHGRKIIRAAEPKSRTAPRPAPREQSLAIRIWAREHGLQVNNMGRIPREVIAKYNQAQGQATPPTLVRDTLGQDMPQDHSPQIMFREPPPGSDSLEET